MGVWLFYVQHQFEHTVWAHDETWNLHEVALHGSSYYVLPGILRWFTANIGVHHVHHLCSRIPYYRLPRVLREHPELSDIGRLTLVAKHQMRAPGAVGREPQEADLVPRDAPHAGVAARRVIHALGQAPGEPLKNRHRMANKLELLAISRSERPAAPRAGGPFVANPGTLVSRYERAKKDPGEEMTCVRLYWPRASLWCSPRARPWPSKKPIKIGFVSTFSGPVAVIGNNMRNSLRARARSFGPQDGRPAGRGDLRGRRLQAGGRQAEDARS